MLESGATPSSSSNSRSTNDLFPVIYEELRRLAKARVDKEKTGTSLNATALVHEVFLRLADDREDPRFQNSAHLFKTAAEAMRWILIDRARARQRLKRGENPEHVELSDSMMVTPASDEQMLAVNDALVRLESEDPESADLVKMRFFAGFTIQEIAENLKVSESTIKRQWAYAKVWLKAELAEV